jgi:hypothetical protein
MNTSNSIFRAVLLASLIGLLSACGGGHDSNESEAEHGHSHE